MTDRSVNRGTPLSLVESRKEKILEAASQEFLAKGFNGASIAVIAKIAGVAKSSVFHHYPSKEALWRAVKATHLTHMTAEELTLPLTPHSLENFLEAVVSQRFKAYSHNPNLSKLVSWQRLETDNEQLAGIENYQPDNWEMAIQHLQKKGLINQEYSAELICIMIYGAISNAFFDHKRKIYNDQVKLKAYKELIIEGLIKALSS